MKTISKILAVALAVMMLCSIIPMNAMAAETETIKVTGSTGVLNGTSSISWSGTNYEVVNDKDNSSTAIRTSDSDHFRVYVGNEFYVRGKDGALMSQVVINCVSSYLINNSANVVDAGWTVSANGTTITYTAVEPSAELHISIGKQSRVKSVVITPAVASNPECDHSQFTCGDICDVCGEEFVHVFDNTCDNECNNCSGANPNFADHAYDGAYDAACNVCGAAREVNFPAADSELSIPEADAIGLGMSHDTTTPGKYYVTGTVESIANTTYGNLYIVDDEGNKLYIYGTYDATGDSRFDAMAEKPQVGMIITVYGVIGNYNKASQMKNGWIVEMETVCEHEYEFDCSKACALCGIELRPEAECSPVGDLCQDSECEFCGEIVTGLGHAYDDQWDPNCNYCGEIREVEEKPEMTEATLDFSTTDQRTEYSTSQQVWENGGLVLTNNKGESTSNVGDYSNPARFYKSSNITISYSGMTQLVIDCSNTGDAKYSTPWGDMLTAAALTYTVENKVYTITFAEPTDSITLSCSAQVRANSITATAVKQSAPACKHEYDNACDVDCNLCGETREVSHTIKHVEANAATCTTEGNIEYWCCDVCGAAWLDEACTLNTNVKSVVLPASCSYNAVYTAAKAATCTENGNVEHWYCANCDVYYADAACAIVTNAKNVIVAASCKYGAVYTAAKAPTCDEPGNIEYWYCANCDVYYADAACTIITNAKSVILPIAHNVIHVEAVPATCSTEGNIEYWYCADCGAAWLDELCHQNTNLKSVKLPASCSYNVVYTAAKAATCTENGNVEYWYCANCDVYYADAACAIVTNAKNVIVAASCKYGAVYTAAKAATCFEPGNEEYWYCANCDVYYADADCTIITNAKNVILPIAHNIIYVEAKAATCTEMGNIEHWYCADCGAAWLDELCHQNTNLKSVVLPASCSYGAVYTAAKAATCTENGNVEYWYCANCDVYYADAACAIVTNAKNVIVAASCKYGAVYTAAKAATCFEPGNTEYWYCANCDVYYADADCTIITNAKNVILPIAHNIIYVEAKAATCTEMGNIEHWYCADCGQAWLDELCHLNTNLKAVVLPAAGHTYCDEYDAYCDICFVKREVAARDTAIWASGKSVSEDVRGLAFKFSASINQENFVIKYGNQFSSGNIIVDGMEYELIEMGAIVSNGVSTKTIPAVYLCDIEEDEVSFAVRVINIPEDKGDVEITATPYYTYVNAEGITVTIQGTTQTATYNGVLG